MEAIYAKADRQREAEMEAMEAEVEQRPEHALVPCVLDPDRFP
jgi:hypothetical protein